MSSGRWSKRRTARPGRSPFDAAADDAVELLAQVQSAEAPVCLDEVIQRFRQLLTALAEHDAETGYVTSMATSRAALLSTSASHCAFGSSGRAPAQICPTAPTSVSMQAARSQGAVAARYAGWAGGLDGYVSAVGMLGPLVTRAITRPSREVLLYQFRVVGYGRRGLCDQGGAAGDGG